MDYTDTGDITRFFSNPMVPLGTDGKVATASKFKVMLCMMADGLYVKIVDRKLNPLYVDPATCHAEGSRFVRAFNQLSNNSNFSGSSIWNRGLLPDSVSLNENPDLMPLLVALTNVVDQNGEEIKFAKHQHQLQLQYLCNSNRPEKGISYMGLLSLCSCPELEEKSPVVQVITSEYAYSYKYKTVYPIISVGPNFANLRTFVNEQVKPADLASVLSLLYSYFSNIDVSVTDLKDERIINYDIVNRNTDDKYIPTLVFEEIDTQNALYVRLKGTVPGIPMQLSDLGLTAYVTRVAEEVKFIVRHIEAADMDAASDLLNAAIHKCAPSKKESRNLLFDNGLYILPEEMAGNFLFHQLPHLLSEFRIIGAEKLKSYKVKAVYPKLNVKLSSGIDFLQGSATVEVENQTFTLADLIKKFSTNRYLQLADGTRAIIDSDYMRRLERIYKHNRGKKGEFKISFFDLPEVESLLDSKVEGAGVKASRDFYAGFAGLQQEKLAVPGLNATLRSYQEDGVKWIKYLYDNNIGGCLADDMGLGKTIQTISALLSIYGGKKKKKGIKPSLIVMPKSLLFNWKSELAKFAPSLTVSTYYGTQRSLDEAKQSQIILTTYSVVRNDIEVLEKEQFHYVILDESQNIKNVGALSTKAVWLLNAEHRLAISGTPIENNLTELYSLFRFLNPTMFGSLEEFNAMYTYPIQKENSAECAEELRRKVFPFILRRLKKNVLTDLPDLTEQVLYAEMEPDQAKFYEERRADYYDQIHSKIGTEGIGKSQFLLFQALSELRRIASIPESLTDGRIASPKIPILVEKLEDAVANGHKVVVFFNFIAGLDIAAEHLNSAGIGFETMTGATHNRQEVVTRFQNDPKCKVLLMTLKTGGVGLNLTAADTVIIFEPWWNKSAELQAINRLHRIGQTAKVMSYSVITSGTIEERILELQQQKSLLVDNIISSDGSAKNLTEEDINFILR